MYKRQLLENPTQFRELVGCLNYVAVSTRPDVAFALSFLGRYFANPTRQGLVYARDVLRYLVGSKEMKLRFGGVAASELVGFCDADWAGDPESRRSTTGFAFLLNGGAISWSSKLQRTVAASSVEAEYQSCSAAAREAIWLKRLLGDLGLDSSGALVLNTDSQGAIQLGRNPIVSPRSKHIDVQHHFVRECEANGVIMLRYCDTEHMIADVLTKALARVKLERCRSGLGVC